MSKVVRIGLFVVSALITGILGSIAWEVGIKEHTSLGNWLSTDQNSTVLAIVLTAIATVAIAMANLWLAKASQESVAQLNQAHDLESRPFLIVEEIDPTRMRLRNVGRAAAIKAVYCQQFQSLTGWRRSDNKLDVPAHSSRTVTISIEPTSVPVPLFTGPSNERLDRVCICFDPNGRYYRFDSLRALPDRWSPTEHKGKPGWATVADERVLALADRDAAARAIPTN